MRPLQGRDVVKPPSRDALIDLAALIGGRDGAVAQARSDRGLISLDRVVADQDPYRIEMSARTGTPHQPHGHRH